MSLTAKQEDAHVDDFVITQFRPSDATDIASAFRRVYGDHYPAPSVYNPASFTEANQSGKATSFIVRDRKGCFAGHLAMVASAPFTAAREIAQGLVLPEHRGRGLLNFLVDYATRHARSRSDCELLFGTAVCNHVVSQRALLGAGFVDAGFEVDYAPARLFTQENASDGRVATAFECRVLKRVPHQTLYLPVPYADSIRRIIHRLDDDRAFLDCPANAPTPEQSTAATADMPTFDMVRTTIREAGIDLPVMLDDVERSARRDGRALAQAVVDLGSPTAGRAVADLRAQGYWFGGLLPRWLGADALLMQKTYHYPNFSGIQVHSGAGRQLLEEVMADRRRVTAPDRLAA